MGNCFGSSKKDTPVTSSNATTSAAAPQKNNASSAPGATAEAANSKSSSSANSADPPDASTSISASVAPAGAGSSGSSCKVVVIGAGFGGNGLVSGLFQDSLATGAPPRDLPPGMSVTMVDPNKTFSIGGTWQFVWTNRLDAIPEWPLEKISKAPHIDLRLGPERGMVTALDLQHKTVTMADGDVLHYDKLVVAPGMMSYPQEIPGLHDSIAVDICNKGQVMEMKQKVEMIIQEAKTEKRTVIVLVTRLPYKCPPVPFEYVSLLDDTFRKANVRDNIRLIVSVPSGFPFAGPPARKLFVGLLDDLGIEYWEDHVVQSVEMVESDEDGSKAAQLNFKVGGGESGNQETTKEIQVHGLFCTFPSKAPEFCKPLCKPNGFIHVDLQTNQAQGFDDVYAIGDVCHAMFPKPQKPHPKAGEFAYLMGVHVAHQIWAAYTGHPAPSPPERNALCVAECGKDDHGVNINPNFTAILADPANGMPAFGFDVIEQASNKKGIWVNGYLDKFFGQGNVQRFPEDISSGSHPAAWMGS